MVDEYDNGTFLILNWRYFIDLYYNRVRYESGEGRLVNAHITDFVVKVVTVKNEKEHW